MSATVNICSVDGCELPRGTRGYCSKHYMRWYRHGNTTGLWEKRPSRGICVIDGCDQTDEGRSRMCRKHATRVRRHGDPHVVKKPRVRVGADNTAWTGEQATYNAMHQRLRKKRGSASKFSCVDCGLQARHWSYDHASARENVSECGPYSPDLEDYSPRCVKCHKKFDLEVIRNANSEKSA